jgi:predicted HTH domain antitoxin
VKNYTEVALAVKLFKDEKISLGKAAKLAEMGLSEFVEYISDQGISIIDYSEENFDQEIDYLNS